MRLRIEYGHPANIRTDAGQLSDDVLVPAVNVKHVLDLGRTAGDKTGNHHRRTGTQIIRLNRRSLELFHTFDHRDFAVHFDMRAHVRESRPGHPYYCGKSFLLKR